MRGRIAATVALLAAVTGAGTAGCATATSTRATIVVDAPTSLADRPLGISVTGLSPRDRVTVATEAEDVHGRAWHAEATYTADGHGRVDLDQAPASGGTYAGVDSMGLFWSMRPATGDPEGQWYQPPLVDHRPTSTVRIAVTAHGRSLAGRILTRLWMAAGVSARAVTPATDRVVGQLFLPPPGTPPHPAVLAFGGSEGGQSQDLTAALLASHGYPALSVAYFGVPGLPATLRDIPLEYFETAARLLARQRGVDPAHILALGQSRGSEAALLVAQDFPTLVHGAILYAPAATAHPAFPDPTANAWTRHGAPVPYAQIPVGRVDGPVLALAGSADAVWPSAFAAFQIMRNLDAAHDPYPHDALTFRGAGHAVGTFPYLPRGNRPVHPLTGETLPLGGTRAADTAAQVQGWRKVLAMLATLEPDR